MIVTELAGGMGNQMFRYAVGRALAVRLGTELGISLNYFHEGSYRPLTLNQWSGVTLNKVSNEGRLSVFEGNLGIPQEFPKVSEVAVSRAESAKRVRDLHDGTYLSGCWESERYFTEIADTLRKEFVPHEMSPEGALLARSIAHEAERSVFLCIRRTDYVTEGRCLPMDYYQKAIRRIVAVEDDPHFFVFSDDGEWVRRELHIPYRMSVVRAHDLNHQSGTGVEAEDIWLMSRCKHAIIPNSTFAWWGAWLNSNPGVIVSPKWNYTEVPESWIRI